MGHMGEACSKNAPAVTNTSVTTYSTDLATERQNTYMKMD